MSKQSIGNHSVFFRTQSTLPEKVEVLAAEGRAMIMEQAIAYGLELRDA